MTKGIGPIYEFGEQALGQPCRQHQPESADNASSSPSSEVCFSDYNLRKVGR